MSWLRASLAVVASFSVLVGCNDPIHSTGFPDTGPHDAARPHDANEDTTIDAGSSTDDTGVPPQDSGPMDDTNSDAGPLNVCTFDAAHDLFEVGADTIMPRVRTVDVAPGPMGWLVTFNQPNGVFEEIWDTTFPSIGMALPLANQFTMDSASAAGPAAAWNGTAYTLAWYSNRDGNYEIYTSASNADPRMAGSIQRLTTDDPAMLIRDDSPAVANGRIVWVRQAMDGSRSLSTQAVMPNGTPIGSAAALTTTGHVPSQPVLTLLDDGSYLVGWSDSTGDAVVYPLSASGSLGAVQSIASEHNASGTLDLAFDGATGAAVFDALESGVRPQVRAVTLDMTGATMGAETILTTGTTETGRDASITALAGGFAVAYRALETNMLRVLLLDLTLHEVQRFDLASVEPVGGRVLLRTSGDGNLLLAWSDMTSTTPAMVHMRAARIRCQ